MRLWPFRRRRPPEQWVIFGGELTLTPELGREDDRRQAENWRLMHAPGTPSYYPYPDDAKSSPQSDQSCSDSDESR
jgi:hypothetical protein